MAFDLGSSNAFCDFEPFDLANMRHINSEVVYSFH
ncbi:unnamed protein product [Ectocarpus sp. CCAP 1310/34]|nr:unnamed protein product [Ectocarpus sp. CCAP 1310/34]